MRRRWWGGLRTEVGVGGEGWSVERGRRAVGRSRGRRAVRRWWSRHFSGLADLGAEGRLIRTGCCLGREVWRWKGLCWSPITSPLLEVWKFEMPIFKARPRSARGGVLSAFPIFIQQPAFTASNAHFLRIFPCPGLEPLTMSNLMLQYRR